MTPEQQAYAHEVADWAESQPTGKLTYEQNDWIIVNKRVLRDDNGHLPIEKMREGQCKTKVCLAGKVAIDKAPAGTTVVDDILYLPDGKIEIIADFARDALGLTYEQSISVFYAGADEAAKRLHYVADHPDAEADAIWRAAH